MAHADGGLLEGETKALLGFAEGLASPFEGRGGFVAGVVRGIAKLNAAQSGNQFGPQRSLRDIGDRARRLCKRGGDVVLAENDDLNLGMKIANFANGLEAIHAGHAEIHNDDIRMEILRLEDGLVAVSSFTADVDVEHSG